MNTSSDNPAPRSVAVELLALVAVIEILKTLARPVFARFSVAGVLIRTAPRRLYTFLEAFCVTLLLVLNSGCFPSNGEQSGSGFTSQNTSLLPSPPATHVRSARSGPMGSGWLSAFNPKSPDPVVAEFLIDCSRSAAHNRTLVGLQFGKFLTALPRGSRVVFITFSRKPTIDSEYIIGQAGGLQNAKTCLANILRSADSAGATSSHADEGTDICSAIDLANSYVANEANNGGQASNIHIILWTDLYVDPSMDQHGHKTFYRSASEAKWPASARTDTDVTVFGAAPSQEEPVTAAWKSAVHSIHIYGSEHTTIQAQDAGLSNPSVL